MYVNPSKMIGVLAKLLKEIFNCSPVLVAAFPIHYKVQTQCKEFPIKNNNNNNNNNNKWKELVASHLTILSKICKSLHLVTL